jgi:hypothetical protein
LEWIFRIDDFVSQGGFTRPWLTNDEQLGFIQVVDAFGGKSIKIIILIL